MASEKGNLVYGADRWRRDLTAAGWISESATACRAPDGTLWRGPYGAWKELQRRVAAEEREKFTREYERLCGWRERWMKLLAKPEIGRLASRQERIEERVKIANNKIRLLMTEFDRLPVTQPTERTNWNIETTDSLLANWPLADVLTRLADAATHLLSDHDCDGYEELQHAVVAARAHASVRRKPRIKEAALDEILDCDKCDLCEDHHSYEST